MAKDHDPEQGGRLERLVEGVQDALLATERANAVRHVEILSAIRGKTDVLGKLNTLRARLAKLAKALAALDAQT